MKGRDRTGGRAGFTLDSLLLTRISHQLSAAAGDAPRPAVFSRVGVLDVPQVRAPRPSGRKPHWARHLAALATKPGEICRLTRVPTRILPEQSDGFRGADDIAGPFCGRPDFWIAVLQGRIQDLARRTLAFEVHERSNRIAPYPGIDVAT